MTDGEDLCIDAIERAAVRGWPALEAARIDGWLARASSGGSVRANSVSALDYTGSDVDASIAAVVAFYRARSAKPCFTVTGVDRPSGLDALLAARGWKRHGDHVTMAKDVGPAVAPAPALPVLRAEAPSEGWMAVYLEGLSESRRAVAPRLVRGVPKPAMFFSCVIDGETVGSGLSVLDGPLASVQCMATRTAARRRGVAGSILAAIESWAGANGARRLYLQAESGNAAAVSLYRRVGFSTLGHYHVRELDA